MSKRRSNQALWVPQDEAIENRWVSLDAITGHPQNYNRHGPAQLADLGVSLQTLGQFRSVVLVDAGGGQYTTVAGHGVVEAARRDGRTRIRADIHPEGTPAGVIQSMLIADNQHATRSQTDETAFAALLEEQRNSGVSLQALGTSDEELASLHDRLAARALELQDHWRDQGPHEDEDPTSDEDDEAWPGDLPPGSDHDDDGALLEHLDLELLTPRYSVTRGDVWRVGPHLLVAVEVFRDWPVWQPWLARQCATVLETPLPDGTAREVLFAPFVGPFVLLSKRAECQFSLVGVQPDLWMAGHVLSYYTDIHGPASVMRLVNGQEPC